MPTLYAPQLIESETPWLTIWDRMFDGLRPVARQILTMLNYYARRDVDVPPPETPLTSEEIGELTPIVSALTIAAVESQRMPVGVQIATLKKVAKAPPQSVGNLPAITQWVMSHSYKRDEEKAGTFALDIWGANNMQATCTSEDQYTSEASRLSKILHARLAQLRPGSKPVVGADARTARRCRFWPSVWVQFSVQAESPFAAIAKRRLETVKVPSTTSREAPFTTSWNWSCRLLTPS
jgi:hypothetical protein